MGGSLLAGVDLKSVQTRLRYVGTGITADEGAGDCGLGAQVRLMPPRYVKPCVKRNKNEMADAEAIRKAVARPTMRFFEIKTPDQPSLSFISSD